MDTSAKIYALSNGIKYTEILSEYSKYGRCAPLKRNLEIIALSDVVIVFWNGKSKGTKFVIDNCKKMNKLIKLVLINND